MKKTKQNSVLVSGSEKRTALASPLRLEIMGLFTSPDPLAIADMARLMGRSAGSLYHHVGLLEKAGLLKRTGTRPKGKRHEALFLPVAKRIELDASSGGEEAVNHAVKTIAAAFRMVERDLAAALISDKSVLKGPQRNVFATRMHMLTTPKTLAQINKHIKAIEDLVSKEVSQMPLPTSKDQHISLTLALLPLKGRGQNFPTKGE